MVKLNPLPPMIVWTCPDGFPGLMTGSARSTTIGDLHGKRQNAAAGAAKVDKSARATLLTLLICILRVRVEVCDQKKSFVLEEEKYVSNVECSGVRWRRGWWYLSKRVVTNVDAVEEVE